MTINKLPVKSKPVWYVFAIGTMLLILGALTALWNLSARPMESVLGRLSAPSSASVLSCSNGQGAGTTVSFAAPSVENDRNYAEAVARYRSGQTSDAYGLFIMLAEEGDPDAARIALFMHRYGAVLYGTPWDADPGDLGYWADVAKSPSTRPDPVFLPIAQVSTGSALAVTRKPVRSAGPQ